MRILMLILSLCVAFFLVQPPVFASESTPAESESVSEYGMAAGKISVWKTKIKTKGAKSGKNVILFLEDTSGKTFPPVEKLVSMDQKGLVFIPHVLAVQKGTEVKFLNNDNVDHNVYFLFENTGETLDIGTWGYGISKNYRFTEPGIVITLCKLHLEMAAYIVVLESPFFTMAEIDGDAQGAFYEIKNIPPGKYLLKAWHKKLRMKGKFAEILVEAGKTTKTDIIITKKKYAK